ncbi:MAG TPA: hypothetical protein VJU82_05320, partial [Acidobacteriaceae bacterium]|nr:hypothetical protein [Acidobacteriaceae bacterium]
VIAPLALLLACSGKQASREDVRSDLTKSISLASEAEMFIGYVNQGHSTYAFASGHLRYLTDEVNRSIQDLSNRNASPDLIKALDLDRVQLNLLVAQIENALQHLQQPDVLAASERQIDAIRMSLVQANSSL